MLPSAMLISATNDLDPETVQTVFIIDAIISALALLGSSFNLFTAIYLGTIKNGLGKMVVFLSIADAISSIIAITLSFPTTSPGYCQFQTFWLYFGYSGSFVWTCCFAHALYRAVREEKFQVIDMNLKIYAILSITVASLIGFYSVAIEIREINMGFCLHVGARGDATWPQLFVVTIPSLISIVFCMISYALVTKNLKKLGAGVNIELLLYPLILIICTGPATFIEIYLMFNPGTQISSGWIDFNYALYVSQGFINALVYGLSRGILNGYRAKCCLKKSSTLEQSEVQTQSVDDDDKAHRQHTLELNAQEGLFFRPTIVT